MSSLSLSAAKCCALLTFQLSTMGCFGAGPGHAHPDGPAVLIDINLPLNSECTAEPGGTDAVTALATGLYDINAGSGYCSRDYNTHLRVHNFLRDDPGQRNDRAGPNVVKIHAAEITLMTQDGSQLLLLESNPPLPNPFRILTSVSLFPSTDDGPSTRAITIKTIPAAYAEFLSDFIEQQIVAKIQIFASTTGGVEVDPDAFAYPIQICDGCLSGCGSIFTGIGAREAREDLIAGCDDDAGQDGRVCYDIGC